MTNKTKQYIILLILFIASFTTIKAQRLHQPHSSSIYSLSDFDKAITCIKFYEGLHTKKDYPYIGYGHCIQPGEKLNWSLTKKQSDALLRSDLKILLSDKNKLKVLKSFVYADFKCFPNRGAYFFF